MRKAFTLIELMISIIILSVLMLFLYKTYSGLNRSNKIYEVEVQKIKKIELVKKVIYLDISLGITDKVKIINQSKTEDVFFMQTSHSIHDRVNPYLAYIVKDKKLYRLESLKEFKDYPLSVDSEFDGDYLGEVKIFRLYKSKEKSGSYLVQVIFEKEDEILLRANILNK